MPHIPNCPTLSGERRGRPVPRIANTPPNATLSTIGRLAWETLHSVFDRNVRFCRGSAAVPQTACLMSCDLLLSAYLSRVFPYWFRIWQGDATSGLRVGTDFHVFEFLFDSAGFALIS